MIQMFYRMPNSPELRNGVYVTYSYYVETFQKQLFINPGTLEF